MRRSSMLAVTLLLFGCSSHSVAPSPGSITPQVFQGHGGGQWLYFRTGPFNTGILHWRGEGMTLISQDLNTLLDVSPTGRVTSHALQGVPMPHSDAVGPDGDLWITDSNSDDIQRVGPSYQITVYPLPRAGVGVGAITAGPDGALWFGESGSAAELGRITTSGQITEFASVPSITSIVTGPDHNLWATAGGNAGSGIYRITTAGGLTQFPIPGAFTGGIVNGPDGALWFVDNEPGVGNLGRITVDGTVSRVSLPSSCTGGLVTLTVGPGGELWMLIVTDEFPNVVYLTSYHTSTQQFSTPVPIDSKKIAGGGAIASGPDGNLYIDGGSGVSLIAVYLRQSLTVTPTTLTISVPGQTANLSVSETNYTGDWSGSSSNKLVATVKRSGTLGTLTVTATGDGTCNITVNDAQRNTVRVKVTVL